MMKCEEEKSEVIYDSFCIKEQKLYLKTFHKLLDRITGIFLLDYALIDDEKCSEYYEKIFQSWLKFLEANLSPDLKRLRYKILNKMIITHKANDPLMSKRLLEEFLNDKAKIYLTLYNFREIRDLKKISDAMRNFCKGELNPADLIYQCLHYDLFEAVDPYIKCRPKKINNVSSLKRFIQKRAYELKKRVYYGEVIDFLFTSAYLLLDPDYQRRGKRGRKRGNDSLPTNPTLYEILPKKSSNYDSLLTNLEKFFEQNHCLTGVLLVKKQAQNEYSKFLDLKNFVTPYVPLQDFRYQEISDANNENKILRISEMGDISKFLSVTGLKDSLCISDGEIIIIDLSYCLTVARHRLNSLIKRIDSIF